MRESEQECSLLRSVALSVVHLLARSFVRSFVPILCLASNS